MSKGGAVQRTRSEEIVANQSGARAVQPLDADKSMHPALEATPSESRAGADRNGRVPVQRITGNETIRTVRRSAASDELGVHRACATYSFA